MTIERSIRITNPTGLHARPAVKLAQLAASFDADVQLRIDDNEQWIKAKSAAKVMKLKATADATLHFRAAGEQASEAVIALIDFVQRDFDEDEHTEKTAAQKINNTQPIAQPSENTIRAVCASEGLANGPLYLINDSSTNSHNQGSVAEESEHFNQAIKLAVSQLDSLTHTADQLASDIIGFQLALLKDEEFLAPVRQAIETGIASYDAWITQLDAEINDYLNHHDDYFQGRTSDLRDLRNRVTQLLSGKVQSAFATDVPEDAILIADQFTPSQFLQIDWTRCAAIVTRLGTQTEHVAMLARANRVPYLIQAQLDVTQLPQQAEAILVSTTDDARLIIDPDQAMLDWYRQQKEERKQTEVTLQNYVSQSGRTADGTEVKVYINVDEPKILEKITPAHCDGIGLTRTEFLFHEQKKLPDEETQYQVYRYLLDWAQGRPVTIRTLDAGADKPIAGISTITESNPFLGVRGIRLSLRNHDIFKVQLRALARAAIHGQLKVMIPMVTLPSELAQVRTLFDEVITELQQEHVAAKMPSLGIMVEVPATALTIADFDADFFSIGSNDLIQYVMAAGRDNSDLADLQRAQHPAIKELLQRIAKHGADNHIEVSICGEIAAIPEYLPLLIESGITSLSVAPTAVALIKQKLTQIERPKLD